MVVLVAIGKIPVLVTVAVCNRGMNVIAVAISISVIALR